MKARKVKRQVQNKPFVKASNQPIIINTTPSKAIRPRGGCCGKKRT
ncbi:hypothetical protein [Halobacillus sp. Nhm2S1]|nr:hypothetical protein [Halobacillus sp. Nhm2S1]MBX0356617.1 hypothetical protein [Halobacillus sp. Nhm2S1]